MFKGFCDENNIAFLEKNFQQLYKWFDKDNGIIKIPKKYVDSNLEFSREFYSLLNIKPYLVEGTMCKWVITVERLGTEGYFADYIVLFLLPVEELDMINE